MIKFPPQLRKKGRNKIKSNKIKFTIIETRAGSVGSVIFVSVKEAKKEMVSLASGWVARSWRHSHCQDSVFALLQGLFQLSEMGPKAVFFYLLKPKREFKHT